MSELCRRSCVLLLALAVGTARAQAQSADGMEEAFAAGNSAMRKGDFTEAIRQFEKITKSQPRLAEGFFSLGLALEQDHQNGSAIAALQKARSLNPSIKGENLFLGIALYRVNRLDAAIDALDKQIVLNPKDASVWMWHGVVDLARGDPDRAAAALDKAAKLDPGNPDILYHLGRAYLLLSKQSYQRMFEADPHSWRVHEVVAQTDDEAGRTEEAIAEYKLAVEQAPKEAGLHEELGDAYWTQGKLDEADSAYQQEIKIDEHSSTALYKLGALRVIVGTPAIGLPLLEQAIVLDPALADAYYYLGRAQVETGQTEKGIAALKRAASQSDESLKMLALYRLVQVYKEQHRTGEATTALAEFRRLKDAKDQRQQAKLQERANSHLQLPRPEQVPAGDPIMNAQ